MSVLVGVPAHLVREVWPAVLPEIERALRHGGARWTTEAIRQKIEAGEKQLWLVNDVVSCETIGVSEAISGRCSVVITQIDVYPRMNVCFLFLVAGRMGRDWRKHLAEIEAWAVAQGCAAIEMGSVRRGWRRRLGWTGTRYVLTKEL